MRMVLGRACLPVRFTNGAALHEQAFVVVNCASISERLLEDTPFDQAIVQLVRSSRERRQRATACGEATIFFDNVSELSELGQARLFQFLEEQNFQSIFQQRPRRTPHRIIVACNRNLAC